MSNLKAYNPGSSTWEPVSTGTQGPPGTPGPEGSQGLQGIKGDKGDIGNTGPQGPQGIPGAEGPSGSDGVDGGGVAPGGAIDQILAKATTTDFATKWVNPTGGGSGEDYTVERSKGGGLIANGTGILKTNYNFSWTTFYPDDHPPGCSGSFRAPAGSGQTRFNDEFIPVDVNKLYMFSLWCRETNPAAVAPTTYTGIASYDSYDNSVQAYNTMYIANTTTTLAVTLIPGATTVTLTNGANWNNAGVNYQRSLIFWNYTDPGGYVWPPETYSRNVYLTDIWLAGGITGNVITLRVPWAGPTYTAGTPLSNATSGSAYMYGPWANQATPTTWTYGEMKSNPFGGGVHTGGTLPVYKFPHGTAKIKIVLLPNRVTNSITAYAGVSLEEYGHTHSATELPTLVPTARTISTTAPLTGGGDLSANRTLAVSNFAGSAAGVVPVSVGGTTNYLRADGTWAAPVGAVVPDATETVKGIVELATTVESTTATDTVRAVTPAGLANRAITTRLINTTAPLQGGGNLTADRTFTVDTFGTAAAGVVPASGGGTTNFLRADGTWTTATLPIASNSIQGIVELTTMAEQDARTSLSLAVTPGAMQPVPRGVLAYVAVTANVATSWMLTGLVTPSITTDGTRRFKITIDGYGGETTSSSPVEVNIYQNDVSVKRNIWSRVAGATPHPLHIEYVCKPSAGNYIYKSGFTGGTSFTAYAGTDYPLFILVEDIGV